MIQFYRDLSLPMGPIGKCVAGDTGRKDRAAGAVLRQSIKIAVFSSRLINALDAVNRGNLANIH